MMRYRLFFLLAVLFAVSGLQAQEQVNFGPLHSADSPRTDWLLPGDTIVRGGEKLIYSGKPVQNASVQREYTLDSTLIAPSLPRYAGACGLHDGLNVSVGLSAFMTSGNNVPHRGGFTQTISATYLTPLTKNKKLWLAGGGYLNHMNWGGDSYRDAGLYAILGYRFNEHWEAYVYGQLSLNSNYGSLYGGWGGYGYPYRGWGYGPGFCGPLSCGILPGGYGMGAAGANVLGAGVRYTNKSFSIGLNVEGVWWGDNTPSYFGKYNYPVPKAE